MKIIIKISATLILIILCTYGFLFYQNNREAVPVGDDKITQSYERSVSWLLNHREEMLRDGNPMLWWMVGGKRARQW